MSLNVLTPPQYPRPTGLHNPQTILTPPQLHTTTFGKLFTYNILGNIFAQPLYVSNLTIPGQGTHNAVIVATENNDVYAFDATSNSGVNGGLLWHVNLGLAAAMPNPYGWGNRY